MCNGIIRVIHRVWNHQAVSECPSLPMAPSNLDKLVCFYCTSNVPAVRLCAATSMSIFIYLTDFIGCFGQSVCFPSVSGDYILWAFYVIEIINVTVCSASDREISHFESSV